MKDFINLEELEEEAAEEFEGLFVKNILTSQQNDRISFHYARMEPGGAITDDQHECIEVYYFLSGSGVASVDDRSYNVGPGNVIYVPSNGVHSVRNTAQEEMHFLAILSPPYI